MKDDFEPFRIGRAARFWYESTRRDGHSEGLEDTVVLLERKDSPAKLAG